MACLSFALIVRLLVWAVGAWAVYAIVTLLLGKIAAGEPFTTAVQVLRIVMIAIVSIAIIYFCAALISCVLPFDASFPRVRG